MTVSKEHYVSLRVYVCGSQVRERAIGKRAVQAAPHREPFRVLNRIFTGYSTTGCWWMIEGGRGVSKVQ